LGAIKDDRSEEWLNEAFTGVETAVRRWRAELPSRASRRGAWGRPKLIDQDVARLLDLRASDPGSNCQAKFIEAFGRTRSKRRIQARYCAADNAIAEMAKESL
jgi:hypothetical protein